MTTSPVPSKVTLRPAVTSDAATLCSAEQAVAATPGLLASEPGELLQASFERKIADLATRGLYLVAEVDGVPRGHLVLDPLLLKALAHVVQLTMVVHEGQEGIGLERHLMQGALQWAEQHSQVGKIELLVRSTDNKALDFYRRMGFKEEGRLTKRVKLADGVYADDVALAWFPRESNFP